MFLFIGHPAGGVDTRILGVDAAVVPLFDTAPVRCITRGVGSFSIAAWAPHSYAAASLAIIRSID
ncbi:hypothetical protein [Methylibium sp.]|uniref:hypothetical protein n=1 Tax=Methylibium sp. TaxID=2067992 RepID=UPI003D0A9C31